MAGRSFKDFTLADLRELDMNDAGSWPLPIRIIVCIIIAALVAGVGYKVILADQITRLETARRDEQDLRNRFEAKQRKVATLDALKEQVAQLERDFASLRGQLPSKTEVANLLAEVSQTRVITGLEEELFKPLSEIPKDFYAELPVELRVLGDYHQFGEFVSEIAALPRIVTLHNVRIKPNDAQRREQAGAPPLTMSATVKTYRYRDDEEVQADKTEKAK